MRDARTSTSASTDVLSGQRPDVERRGYGVRHESGIRESGEGHEGGTVRERRRGAARELEREPRLAGATRAGQRQQARVPE